MYCHKYVNDSQKASSSEDEGPPSTSTSSSNLIMNSSMIYEGALDMSSSPSTCTTHLLSGGVTVILAFWWLWHLIWFIFSGLNCLLWPANVTTNNSNMLKFIFINYDGPMMGLIGPFCGPYWALSWAWLVMNDLTHLYRWRFWDYDREKERRREKNLDLFGGWLEIIY